MTDGGQNILMVSADRWVVAGEQGPFHTMLEGFSRHWDRIDVIGLRPDSIEATQVFGNVHLHHPTTGKLAQPGFIERTGRRLASERPYVVITSHDYNPFYNGLGSWRISRATGIPYVAEIHHVPGHPRPASARERLDRVATRAYVKWAGSRAAAFRVVNAVELPELLKRWGVPAERIEVLPSLYLDLETFVPEPRDDDPEPCDLLMVGRLVPNKGHLQVLEALRRLRNRAIGEVRLRIIGRGPLEGALERFIRQHGLQGHVERVPWVAEVSGLAGHYRSARYLVCASTSEGGPRIVAEAMACGTPVVSTTVGVVPELIDDGRNGLLYDGTTNHLTLRLQRALADAALETRLGGVLPGDLSSLRHADVLEHLADGLKRIAAAHRARKS